MAGANKQGFSFSVMISLWAEGHMQFHWLVTWCTGASRVPHPSLGSARRVGVSQVDDQAAVIREAVYNHAPQVLVVDEILSLKVSLLPQVVWCNLWDMPWLQRIRHLLCTFIWYNHLLYTWLLLSQDAHAVKDAALCGTVVICATSLAQHDLKALRKHPVLEAVTTVSIQVWLAVGMILTQVAAASPHALSLRCLPFELQDVSMSGSTSSGNSCLLYQTRSRIVLPHKP
jgi:hypothetical protein